MEIPPNQNLDDVVCLCFGTTRADIEAHFSKPGSTFESLVEQTSAGTKCTACFLDLDLVVSECSGKGGSSLLGVKDSASQRSGLPFNTEFSDSGFFINTDCISTVVRVANYGPMFKPSPHVVPYQFVLRLFSNAGTLVAQKAGQLSIDDALQIELKDIPDLPSEGWFLISLTADQEGCKGSIRPQVGLMGADWVTSYHPQLHSSACRFKAVAITTVNDRFSSRVSLINGGDYNTAVTLELYDRTETLVDSHKLELGRMASTFVEMDSVFQNIHTEGAFTLGVKSDRPIRKHILNIQRNGSISMDHFPNVK